MPYVIPLPSQCLRVNCICTEKPNCIILIPTTFHGHLDLRPMDMTKFHRWPIVGTWPLIDGCNTLFEHLCQTVWRSYRSFQSVRVENPMTFLCDLDLWLINFQETHNLVVVIIYAKMYKDSYIELCESLEF